VRKLVHIVVFINYLPLVNTITVYFYIYNYNQTIVKLFYKLEHEEKEYSWNNNLEVNPSIFITGYSKSEIPNSVRSYNNRY